MKFKLEKFQLANGHEKPWMFNYNPQGVIYVPETLGKKGKKLRFSRLFQKKPKKVKTEQLDLSVEQLNENNNKKTKNVESQGCCNLS